MAWIAVDKEGRECIYQFRPIKRNIDSEFIPRYEYSMWLVLPHGSIRKLIGKNLTCQDEPVELKED